MIRVVGLDLSTRSAGVARLTVDDEGVPSTWTGTFGHTLDENATLVERWLRLEAIASEVDEHVDDATDLVVVEGPALDTRRPQRGRFDLWGGWWLVVDRLLSPTRQRTGHAVVVVSPKTRAMYATGNGNADKDSVLQAIRRHYGQHFTIPLGPATGPAGDVADAVAMAALGARHLEHPIDDPSPLHLRALDRVRWPHRENRTAP